MNLTKKQALEECIVLWEEIKKHPLDTKRKAIRSLGKPYFHLDAYLCGCPCCEYDFVTRELQAYECSSCPIWGNQRHTCSGDLETFGGWQEARNNGDLQEAARCADNLVKLAKKALDEL